MNTGEQSLSVDTMLGHRCRRWTSIKLALVRGVLAWYTIYQCLERTFYYYDLYNISIEAVN